MTLVRRVGCTNQVTATFVSASRLFAPLMLPTMMRMVNIVLLAGPGSKLQTRETRRSYRLLSRHFECPHRSRGLMSTVSSSQSLVTSECAPGGPESAGTRTTMVARVHQVTSPMLVRAPGTKGVSKAKATSEYQGQNQKGKHGSHPVSPPAKYQSYVATTS